MTRYPQSYGFRLGYRPALDGLRGVAILLVLGTNAQPRILPGGFLGVDLFFALSGFLITCMLIEEWCAAGAIGFSRFYMRRILRLWPGLLAFLACCGLYSILFQSGAKAELTQMGIVSAFFYVANWVLAMGQDLGSLSHTWSLAVEEQFYIVWPPILWLLLARRFRPRSIVAILGGGMVACLLWRVWLWEPNLWPRRLFVGSDTRADALIAGCILAVVLQGNLIRSEWYRPLGRAAFFSLATLLLVATTVPWDSPLLYQGLFTVIAVLASLTILGAIANPQFIGGFLAWPGLVWVGRLSYGLYIWHYPVFRLNLDMLPIPGALLFVARVALVFGLSTASYYLIERRFLRLKNGWASIRQTEPLTS